MDSLIHRIGFWSGCAAFSSTVAFVIFQVLQLLGMLIYPWDEISIYGFSLGIVIPFLVEMLALHHTTSMEKKFWSHGALIFTVLYVAFVTANYVVQLATVIPATMVGDVEKIGVLVQTPHSLFWNFDALGYVFMGFATLFAVPVFEKDGVQKWVRYAFLAHGCVTTPLIAWVYFYPVFSDQLLLIGLPWAVTAPLSMLLLALFLKSGPSAATQ